MSPTSIALLDGLISVAAGVSAARRRQTGTPSRGDAIAADGGAARRRHDGHDFNTDGGGDGGGGGD